MKKWLAQLTIPLLGLLSLVAAQTLTNLTVDDSDPRIVYVGNWESAARHTSALDYGGTHVLSSDPLGSATFSFTGVAVYYFAPKWPYTVDSYVALDGGSPTLVSMTGPLQDSATGEETIAAAALWSETGLNNTNHQIVVTPGPSRYTVSDGFIYTIQSEDTASQSISTVLSTSTSGSGSRSSSTSTSDPLQGNTSLIIAITVPVVAIFFILLIILLIFMRRRKKKNAKDGPGAGEGAYIIPANNSAITPMSYSDLTGSTSLGSLVAQQQMAHANMQHYGQDLPGFHSPSNPALIMPTVNPVAEGSTGSAYNATPFDYKAIYQPQQKAVPEYANIGASSQPSLVGLEKARFEGANAPQESNGQSSRIHHPSAGASQPPSYIDHSQPSGSQRQSRMGSPPTKEQELKSSWF